MSEAFIAHASTALNNAWSQDNTLVVDCAPLSDALNHLFLNIANLTNELANQREHVDSLRTQQITLQAENSALRSRLAELGGNVASLMDASTGMVGRQEYAVEVNQLKAEIDNKFREQLDMVLSRMASVTRVADEDRQRVLALTDSVDTMRNSQLEGLTSLRQAVGIVENAGRGMNAERTHAHVQLLQKHEAFAATNAQELVELKAELVERMEKNRVSGSEDLTKSVADLLRHLDAQAQRVDGMQRAMAEKAEQIPTKKDIGQLCANMEGGRVALEASQVQLQETFAQCMSLLETSAANGSGGVNNNNNNNNNARAATMTMGAPIRRSPVQNQAMAMMNGAASASFPANNISFASMASMSQTLNSTVGGGGDGAGVGGGDNLHLPQSQHHFHPNPRSSSSDARHHQHDFGAPGTFTSAFAIFERRLDHVQGLVERVLHEELPFLAADSKARHDDHLVLVAANRRAEAMLVALCDVIEIGTMESFAVALRLPGPEQARHMVRNSAKRILEPILGELITPQFLSRIGASGGGATGLQPSQRNVNNSNAENDAQRLLKNPTVAAANSRYEAAMKLRGGDAAGPPDPRGANSNAASTASGSSSFMIDPPQFASMHLRLGVDIADISIPDTQPPRPGVGIMTIGPNSVADRGGLARGDIIIKFHQTPVATCEQFMSAVQLTDRRIKADARVRKLKKLEGAVEVVVLRSTSASAGALVETPLIVDLEWS